MTPDETGDEEMMTADEYQQLALRTEHTPHFVNATQSDIPDQHLERVIHGILGMCSETGELQDMVKKHLMYGKDFDPINLIEECGDVLWYIAMVLDAVGYKLSDCMERNINKLRIRYPDKFTKDRALQRDLFSERAALKK